MTRLAKNRAELTSEIEHTHEHLRNLEVKIPYIPEFVSSPEDNTYAAEATVVCVIWRWLLFFCLVNPIFTVHPVTYRTTANIRGRISAMQPIEISAVAYEEGGRWIVQGLEYDINTQADSPLNAHDAFTIKVLAEVAISLDLGKEPLQGIDPAPPEFWKMFKETSTSISAETSPVRLSDHTVTPQVIIPRMKLGQLQAA